MAGNINIGHLLGANKLEQAKDSFSVQYTITGFK